MMWIWVGAVGLLATPLIFFAVALALPYGEVVTRVARLSASTDAVWAALTDEATGAEWRSDLRRVERLADRDGRACWREIDGRGRSTVYEVVSGEPAHRLIRRIVDSDRPIGGSWMIRVEPTDGGSAVTVTRKLEIHSPWLRLSRGLGDPGSEVTRFLTDLGRRLGEEVDVREAG